MCRRDRNGNGFYSYEFKLSLSEIDIDHLYKFNEFLNSNHEIKLYVNNTTTFKTKNKEARLYICNKYFGEMLYHKYGMIPNRFNINKLINKIPEIYYKDFIRGIIDAEGSLKNGYVYDNKKLRYKSGISISTYEELLNFIQDYLINVKLIINKGKLTKRHNDRDAYCMSLAYCGNVQVPKILKHLYNNASIFLERKYNIYLDIIHHTSFKDNLQSINSVNCWNSLRALDTTT